MKKKRKVTINKMITIQLQREKANCIIVSSSRIT